MVIVVEDLVHAFKPRGAALELFNHRDREILMAGPAGTGKSRACLEKLNAVAMRYPGMRGLIVRKTQQSLSSTALDTWRKAVLPENLAKGMVKFYGGSAAEPPQYRYDNGSTILIGGMDTTGDQIPKIMSSEYDFIYVQEATELKEEDWEALTTRLRNWKIPEYQQMIADCNPGPPTHWLKRRCDLGKTLMLHSRHEDNPMLYDDAGVLTEKGAPYMATLDALTGVRRLRLRDGIWAAAEGLVFDGFDAAVHVVARFEVPEDWPAYWCVDFGFTNPFTFQCWREDPDGRLYLTHELYGTQTLVEDWAQKILALRLAPFPNVVICDHDAEDRATLEKHLGTPSVAAKKTVSDGIQAVATRLRPAGDGKPRLFIFEDSLVERDQELMNRKKPTCVVEEFPGYVWASKPGGLMKEEPVKADDHGLDALRYMVAQLDLRGEYRIRWLG